MKKYHIASVIVILFLWQIVAAYVHNDILIPYPLQTLQSLFLLFIDKEFYLLVFTTILRTLKGYLLSLFLALTLSIFCYKSEKIHSLFLPLQIILESIPNISYILVALIWLGAEGAVSVVTFMILFPVFFNGFYGSLCQLPSDLKDVSLLFREKPVYELKYFLFPTLTYQFYTTGKTAALLGLKVGVMAEILGQVRKGIGRELYLSKIYFDTTMVIAYTVVIILISLGITWIFKILQTYTEKKEKGLLS